MSEERCHPLVVIPTLPNDEKTRSQIRKRGLATAQCIFFFVGESVATFSRKILCDVTKPYVSAMRPCIQNSSDVVLLDGHMEAYSFMGWKLIRILMWSFSRAPLTWLYMDADYATRATKIDVIRMVSSVSNLTDARLGGCIMNCLTYANQACTGGDSEYKNRYKLRDPYVYGPPFALGSDGIVLNAAALSLMQNHKWTTVHPFSDHTVSHWARDAGVSSLSLCSGRRIYHMCRNLRRSYVKLNATTWKCKNRLKSSTCALEL